MRLIAYLRVSSAGQIDAWGLDRQEEAVKQWAKANNAKIVRWYRDEGLSGTLDHLSRPGLCAAIESIGPGVDGIVAADLDRFARQLMVQEAAVGAIWGKGGRIFTATAGEIHTDDPDGVRTLIRQVLGAVVQFNKTQAVAKMRQGREAKAKAGKKSVGQYAYGYRGEGKGRERDAAPHPDEQPAVDMILRMRRGGASYRDIVSALDRAGLPPRRAARWSPMAVRSVAIRHGLTADR